MKRWVVDARGAMRSWVLPGRRAGVRLVLACAAALVASLCSSAGAQNFYWDLNGAAADVGSPTPSGTWNTTSSFWNPNSTGIGATTTWTDVVSVNGGTESNSPFFSAGGNGTGSFTVTVPTGQTRRFRYLTVEEGQMTLTGGTLQVQERANPAGSPFQQGFNVAAGSSLVLSNITLNGVDNGGGSGFFAFYKEGAGTMYLGSGVTVQAGQLVNIQNGAFDAGNATFWTTNNHRALLGVTAGDGVLQGFGTLSTTALGTSNHQVGWHSTLKDSGGFAARGGTLNVTLRTGSPTLTWNEANFIGNGKALLFGSTTADSQTVFNNPLNLNGQTQFIKAIDNPNSTNDSARLTGQITNGGLTVTGDGTLILAHASNNYSGPTVVDGATLLVTGALTGTSSTTVQNGGRIGGTGSITNGYVIINSGAIDAPGNNAIGSGTFANERWMGGGRLELEFADVLGTAGTTWDLRTVNGTLDISNLTANNPFIVDLNSLNSGSPGLAANFDVAQPWVREFLTLNNLLGAFSSDLFQVDASGFLNHPIDGSFTIVQTANGLGLQFSIVPEPASIAIWAVLGIGAAGYGWRRRQRART